MRRDETRSSPPAGAPDIAIGFRFRDRCPHLNTPPSEPHLAARHQGIESRLCLPRVPPRICKDQRVATSFKLRGRKSIERLFRQLFQRDGPEMPTLEEVDV